MRYLSSFVIASFGAVFGGCMMMSMGGGMMGGDGHHQSHDGENMERIVKEVMYGDCRITAEFPPLLLHEEVFFSLQIELLNDSLVNDAVVWLAIAIKNDDDDWDAVVDEVLVPSTAGRFEHSFIPHDKGEYRIGFRIEQLNGTPVKSPLTVSVTRPVTETLQHVHGPPAMTTLIVIGSILMIGMMVTIRMF
jgi:hypothetical protein